MQTKIYGSSYSALQGTECLCGENDSGEEAMQTEGASFVFQILHTLP